MKNLTWQNPEQLFVAQELINKVKSKCCGIKENQNLFDFELDAEDMQAIAKLDIAHSLFLDHHSGETTKQFMEWRAVVKPTE